MVIRPFATNVLALLLLLLPVRIFAAHRKFADQGTFQISLGGKPTGTEKFSIQTSNEGVEAIAKVDLSAPLNGKRLEFHTSSNLVLDKKLQPQTYTWSQRSERSSSLKIDFRSSPVTAEYHTVNGKSDVRQFQLPKDLVVLDDNVLSQYEILVELYDQTSKGKEDFAAFVPQEALPGRVTVEETGSETIEMGGRTIETRHYTVTTDLAQIDLWADKEGRLLRISMPATQLEGDRQ